MIQAFLQDQQVHIEPRGQSGTRQKLLSLSASEAIHLASQLQERKLT